MYFFEVCMVPLRLEAIERGFKADLIESRHLPNDVPSATLNIVGMNHINWRTWLDGGVVDALSEGLLLKIF